MSQISILYRLQQIDTQLDSARISIQNIINELNDNTLLSNAQQVADHASQLHKAELKNLREAENKSYDTRIKIDQSESSLYGGKIQNPKELQDLQNEIASLKKLITTFEDRELEAMEAVEEAEAKLQAANEQVKQAQGTQIEHYAHLNGEKTRLQSLLDRLESERTATIAPLSPVDLGLYEQLRKSRKGVAVAKITSRACAACGTTLTAAVIQTVQSTGQMVRCPTCGRILYPG